MRELSLHILDLVQNSIAAGASLIEIDIEEAVAKDLLTVRIKDNGCGMDKDFLQKVMDPFTTTRTSRKVGLGVPMMQAACRRCDGDLTITSEKGVGTELTATFKYSHIDRAPIGNIVDTLVSLVMCSDGFDIIYRHSLDEEKFEFDTGEIKKVLGSGVSLSEPEVLNWIRDYLNEGLNNLRGGVGYENS